MLGGLLLASLLTLPPTVGGSIGDAEPSAGRRIDIELQNTEVHEVFRLLADIGKVNIVAGKDVSGRVTARFTAVPWDEVLAHVLISLQLRMRRDGNVIYVTPAKR